MKWFAAGLLVLSLFMSYLITYSQGQRSVRMATVVRSGSPYYRGIYFGECLSMDQTQFCATDKGE
jgi:hypothetical protein